MKPSDLKFGKRELIKIFKINTGNCLKKAVGIIPHPSTIKGIDSIIEYILVDNPDFSDLDALTNQIENDTLKFIDDVENFIS